MRVFKPLQLSLLTKAFTWEKKHHLAVTVLMGFPFDDSKECMLEQDLWNMLPEQLGKDSMLDMGMPKPNGEVVMYGNFYAPNNQPIKAGHVQLKIGDIDKTLSVIGDRYWRTLLAPTEPEEFTQMPLNYEYAFGGADHALNPIGKGIADVDYFGEMRQPLPNIENPNSLVTSPGQRPPPAGFAPLDIAWKKRTAKAGTYDEKWQKEYFPAPPPDLNWEIYNTTEEDQWISGFWQGNESFELSHVHKEKITLHGKLPNFSTRCVIAKDSGDQVNCTEVDMRAETVFLLPEVETGVMLFRGTIEVDEDDATDVDHILVAYEDLLQTPQASEYYEQALKNRLDEKQEFKFMMSTKDIIPTRETCGFVQMLDSVEMNGQSALSENLDARVAEETEKAMAKVEEAKQEIKEKLVNAGIDPTEALAKFDAPTEQDPMMSEINAILEKLLPGITENDVSKIKLDEIDFSQFEKLNEVIEKFKDEKIAEVKQQLLDIQNSLGDGEKEQQAKQKIQQSIEDIDKLPELPRINEEETILQIQTQLDKVEKQKQYLQENGLPTTELDNLNINIEEISQKLKEGVEGLKSGYLMGAHYIEGRPPHKEPLDIIKYRFTKLLKKQENLVGRDFSGVDFSGMDLSNLDLSQCYLEYCNFSDCNLTDAKLGSAIATHANFTRANLSRTVLEKANLGDSNLSQAFISDIQAKELVLSKCVLKEAQFSQCVFDELNVLETNFHQAKFKECVLSELNIIEMDLTQSTFENCQMMQCNFLQSKLDKSVFKGSNISSSNFVECELSHCDFSHAQMSNVRFLQESVLSHSKFTHAVMDNANLQGAVADHCDFEYTSFKNTIFDGANLQHTKFYHSVGLQARFEKADLLQSDFTSVNLMEGSLHKARLTNADLSNSNLYSVNLRDATIGDTHFKGANLDLTILEDWRPS